MKELLEKMVREASKKLEAQGVCKLWKIPNDLRITGNGQMTFASQTPCDFFGHDQKGRILMIECKDISGARLPLTAAGLKPHQRTALEECAKVEGCAIVLWKHQNRVVCLTPWDVAQYTKDRRSVAWKAVENLSVPFTRDDVSDLIAQALR
jgi:penicillin-binding protein-related factor A (putative recombinase)